MFIDRNNCLFFVIRFGGILFRSLIAGFAIVKSAIVALENIFGGPRVFGAKT